MIIRRNFMKVGALAAGGLMVGRQGAMAASPFEQGELPFAHDALEPHIDATTMEIHHGKHHAGYVKNLNAALEKNPDLAKKSLEELLGSLPAIGDEALRTTVRNNAGGHWNHSFFWATLSPADKSGKPSDDLAAAINAEFGSLDKMKEAFAEAAGKRFGSGWAWLIEKDGKLKITSTPNQDAPVMKGLVPDEDLGKPLLGLDVWEHAYYLKYQNRRPEYVGAWWNVVNWESVSARL